MAYTLGQAALAAGRDRSTISRMIKRGRLSATRDEVTGGWLIEPAELHRLYPAMHGAGHDVVHPAHDAVHGTGDAHALLHAKLAATEARLDDAQETIRDLRARLDSAEARLDRLLLADQRPAAPVPATPPPRRWWRWRRA